MGLARGPVRQAGGIEKGWQEVTGRAWSMAGDHLAGRGWMVLVADETGSHGVLAFAQAAGLGPVVHDNQPNRAAWRSGVPAFLPYPRPERAGQTAAGPLITTITMTVSWHPRPLASPPDRLLRRFLSTGRLRGASYSSRGARRNPSPKGRTDSDDSYRAGTTSQHHRESPRAWLPGWPAPRAQVPGYPSGDHAGAGESAPRARAQAGSRFCARLRPGNTAELASLVLYMGEEIDRRERMLDAALRATAEAPGERV